MKAIVNGKIILRDGIVENKALLYDERIIAINDDITGLKDVELMDAAGCYVSPGFVDIHIHGACGCDAMDGNIQSLDTISKGICQYGVTSFLPTTISMSKISIQRALENIRRARETGTTGAKVLGAHLEGPFINVVRKGAHAEEFIIKADYELIKDYLDIIKIITIAPEIEGNLDFIKDMNRHPHISFSIGHSNATYEESISAIHAGVKSATHLFNAMSGLNHREPGVVGAALNSNIYCELIADKIHVHPAMFKVLANVKGSDKIILITDAIRAACMKQGLYELGGQPVLAEQGAVRLADGTLAGSVLRMDEAIRNFYQCSELSLHEVIAAATINPAKLIGADSEIGSIEVGKKADMVILDEGIHVRATIIDGKQYR